MIGLAKNVTLRRASFFVTCAKEEASRTVFCMAADATYVIKLSRNFVADSRGVECRCVSRELCRPVTPAGDLLSRVDL